MRHASPARLQPYERLHIAPITLRRAREYVNAHHRHLRAPTGGKLAIAVWDGLERLRGVAILGRPVARRLDDGATLEVTRVATDGCRNACSALYGASRRVAKALGYRAVVTYTLFSDHGTSLRASGWTETGRTSGGACTRAGRSRADAHPLTPKRRWTVSLV